MSRINKMKAKLKIFKEVVKKRKELAQLKGEVMTNQQTYLVKLTNIMDDFEKEAGTESDIGQLVLVFLMVSWLTRSLDKRIRPAFMEIVEKSWEVD